MSRDGSVGIATRLRAGPSNSHGSVSAMGRVFLFSRGPLDAPFIGGGGSDSDSVVAGASGSLLTPL